MRFFFVFIFIGFLILSSGCSAIKNQVNNKFPPISEEEIVKDAIKHGSEELKKVKEAEIYVSVSEKDLENAVTPISNDIEFVKSIRIETGQQKLLINIKFDGFFEEIKSNMKGEVDVAIIPHMSGNDIVLRPAARTVKLSKIKIEEGPLKGVELRKAAELIANVLNAYMDNINGQLEAQHIPIEVGEILHMSPEGVLGAISGASNPSGTPYSISVNIAGGAILIDKSALHVLTDPDFVRESRKKSIPSTVPANYEEYLGEFVKVANSGLDSNNFKLSSETSIAVSLESITSALNIATENVEFSADINLPNQKENIDELIEIENDWNLDCSYSDIDCSMRHIDCRQTKDCRPRWSCPNCDLWDVDCHRRRIGCEADKVRYKTQCEITKEGRRIKCEANKAADKLVCEMEKAAKKTGCEINKEWLKITDGANVGRLNGDVDAKNLSASITLHKGSVGEKLSEIILDTTISASAHLDANINFIPYDLGHILCYAPWSGDLNTDISFIPRRVKLLARHTDSKVEDSGLVLEYSVNKISYQLKSSVKPYLALTYKNPDFLLKCQPLAWAGVTIGILAKSFREDLMSDTFDFEIEESQIKLEIPNLTLPILESQERVLNPSIKENVLWFK